MDSVLVLERNDIELYINQEQEGEIISAADNSEEKDIAPDQTQESSKILTPEKGPDEELTKPEPIQTEQIQPESKLPENGSESNSESHPLTEEELEDLILGRAEVVGGKAIG